MVVSVEGSLRGLRGLDVESGSESGPFGWLQHGEGVASAGKGFVSPDAVCWPTRNALYFLNPLDGSLTCPPLPGNFGNLSATNGRLISATRSEVFSLSKYGPIDRRLPLRGNIPSQLIVRDRWASRADECRSTAPAAPKSVGPLSGPTQQTVRKVL